jgi:pyruvate dehydrogenase E1 component alpha subunit
MSETLYDEMYRKMVLIRMFEDQARDLFMKNMMRGSTHSYIGEEAIAVGVCAALNKDDTITSTHRGHGHCLAKGSDPKRMMAELLGRATGYCKGKGGSMHIADLIPGIWSQRIVGGGVIRSRAARCLVRKGEISYVFGNGAQPG